MAGDLSGGDLSRLRRLSAQDPDDRERVEPAVGASALVLTLDLEPVVIGGGFSRSGT